jgi:hypothetical protein
MSFDDRERKNVTARTVRKGAFVLTLLAAISVPLAAQRPKHEPELSAEEARVVDQKIEGLRSEADRNVARSWSNSKKVAEILCRPAATAYWKKKTPGTDRVFLGTSDPSTLELESNGRLTGSGQYRSGGSWTDFHFTCELNADRGAVTKFEATPVGHAGKP